MLKSSTPEKTSLAGRTGARLSNSILLLLARSVTLLLQIAAQHNTLFSVGFQAALVFCSLALAWFLRFDLSFPYRFVFLSAASLLILIRMVTLHRFNLFHGWWRYTGMNDVSDILKAAALGSVIFFFLLSVVLDVRAFPRSVYVLEGLLTAGVLVGARLLIRALRESVRSDLNSSKRVILIGAGFAADMILREINRQGSGYVAVACVDDDPSKVGLRIHGVPVLGTVDQLPLVLKHHPADEIFIAVPSVTGTQMQRFVSICEQTGLKFRTVPAFRELITDQVTIRQLRDVNLDDLLGREPVRINLEFVERQIRNRVILVTGAAGSIGSELSRQILTSQPASLVCLDHSETGMFYLQLELEKCKGNVQLVCCVADIRDHQRMRGLLHRHKPEVIFHAAAYKHVPVMEDNVQEAVQNNVFGLLDLLEVAKDTDCRSFVLISSDKAVNPSNVMGATKRICELIVACRPRTRMRCVSVRFGNVLGSSGSIVPILQEQLRTGQQVTITHPSIRRFFMTTHEAVSLVLQAFAVGGAGEILVLDMGQSLRILDLAYRVARLAGKAESEVRVRFTGLRPGEKLQEELFYPTEEVLQTTCPKVRKVRSQLVTWPRLERQLEELRACLHLDGDAPIRAKLKEIVPEFSCPAPKESTRPAAEDDIRAATASA